MPIFTLCSKSIPSTLARKPCTKCCRDCSPSPTTSMPASSCTLSQSKVASALARSSSAPLDFHSGHSFSVSASQEGLGRLPAMAVSNIERIPFCTSGAAARAAARPLRYRRHVSADADSPADDAEAPLAAGERIAALDVLRGFALLGIFIMNMPAFSHSLFTLPEIPPRVLDAIVAGLREMLFAGKFNLLFGLVFGIGFAIQMARFDDAEAGRAARLGIAPRRHRATQVYARRLAFLFFVGLLHAMLIWSGDVL